MAGINGAVIGALILISQGAIQNFHAPQTITTLTGATRTIPGGAVASQEDIKGDLIAMIEQSAARLDTVVGNLLINARTYAPDSKVLRLC